MLYCKHNKESLNEAKDSSRIMRQGEILARNLANGDVIEMNNNLNAMNNTIYYAPTKLVKKL